LRKTVLEFQNFDNICSAVRRFSRILVQKLELRKSKPNQGDPICHSVDRRNITSRVTNLEIICSFFILPY
jgi:hypothetical protein